MTTEREALDRIAALCDGFQADGHGDAVSITSVRAVLEQVTPEPDYAAVNRSLLRRLKAAQAGGVLDRDQAYEVLAAVARRGYLGDALDRLAAAVRPATIDRDALRHELAVMFITERTDTFDDEVAADRVLALVRPVAGGVTLTPEEAARAASALHYSAETQYDESGQDRALAARLESLS